jgi:hypothetical protein
MSEAHFDAAWASKGKFVPSFAEGEREVGDPSADRVFVEDIIKTRQLCRDAAERRRLEESERGRPVGNRYMACMREKRRGG